MIHTQKTPLGTLIEIPDSLTELETRIAALETQQKELSILKDELLCLQNLIECLVKGFTEIHGKIANIEKELINIKLCLDTIIKKWY